MNRPEARPARLVLVTAGLPAHADALVPEAADLVKKLRQVTDPLSVTARRLPAQETSGSMAGPVDAGPHQNSLWRLAP